MIEITPRLFIDESELEERFFRAGGPGGQNVKTVLPVSRSSNGQLGLCKAKLAR